jgi:hypothetical protein
MTATETRRLQKTPYGTLLLTLRLAQQASDRAKSRAANGLRFDDYIEQNSNVFAAATYRRSRAARVRDYNEKMERLEEAAQLATEVGVNWGFGQDEGNDSVIYFDLPSGQASFHVKNFGGPEYTRAWDGMKGATASRIQEAITRYLAGEPEPERDQTIAERASRIQAAFEQAQEARLKRARISATREKIHALLAGAVWRHETFTLANYWKEGFMEWKQPLVVLNVKQRPHARSREEYLQLLRKARQTRRCLALRRQNHIISENDFLQVGYMRFVLCKHKACMLKCYDLRTSEYAPTPTSSQRATFKVLLQAAREIRRYGDAWRAEQARIDAQRRHEAEMSKLILGRLADLGGVAREFNISGRSQMRKADLWNACEPLVAKQVKLAAFDCGI